MHENQLVHCDIKPSNIMLFSVATWKLIDFDETRTVNDDSATRFTPAYAPPEIIMAAQDREENPSLRTSIDMWSFGIIVYEVIEGKKLLEQSTHLNIINIGKRFYSDELTAADVARLLDSNIVEVNLRTVKDEACRRILRNLLVTDPSARWTAEETMQAELFKSDGWTSTEGVASMGDISAAGKG